MQRLGVIGCGLMGAGIAQVSVQKDFDISLYDANPEQAAKAEKQIWHYLSQLVKKRALSTFEQKQHMARLHTPGEISGLHRSDLIIEAVFEDVELKHTLLSELDTILDPSCVIASNTSAIPISQLASFTRRPEQVIGMHYFSPVPKMPLLEVVVTPKTSKTTCSRAVDVGLRQGKTVMVVKDSPGFYTTRILAPLLDEALVVLLEGVPADQINQIVREFGFPLGPFELVDKVGHAVVTHVAEELSRAFGSRISGADWNLLGQKLKAPTKTRRRADRALAERLVLRLINEAIWCLQDQVIQSPDDGDLAAVLGLGYPPFLGGPFRTIDLWGSSKVHLSLEALAKTFGPRFAPAPLLVEMAKGGKRFLNLGRDG